MLNHPHPAHSHSDRHVGNNKTAHPFEPAPPDALPFPLFDDDGDAEASE